MRNKGQLIFGGIILVFGLLLLIGNLLDIALWRFIWPLCLIAIGFFIIFRQQKGRDHTNTYFGFARDINLMGPWDVKDAEYWHFAADLDLDLTNAEIPDGEHLWRLYGFGDLQHYLVDRPGHPVQQRVLLHLVCV